MSLSGSPSGRARRAAGALLWVIALFLLVAAVQVSAATRDAARADGSANTVDGTWHAWNPMAKDNGDGTFKGAYESSTPSVTVSQTQNLVDQVVHVSWKNFTPSSNDPLYYSTGGPGTGVTIAQPEVLYEVEVFECAGADPTENPRENNKHQQCYSAEITPGAVDGGHGENDAVRAVTQNDGTGSVDFHVENKVTNDLLGCDPSNPCSIVVVPNNGGVQSTSEFDDTSRCGNHSQDFLGPPNYDQFLYTADQTFVGSACSWADRIAVPIHFAPIPSDCPSSSLAFNAVGSPMLERSLDQLLAGWCRGKNALNFGYNSTSDEYDARTQFLESGNALTASTDVALVTQPADPSSVGSKKFTYAPIANNAISIPYYVDDPKTGLPITDLRLDARLVAKLLTQSYQPFHYNCQGAANPKKESADCDPNVAGNPASIFDDPEFQKLNMGPDHPDHPDRSDFPDSTVSGNQDALGGFFPTVLAGQSDLSWELTRWIDSDKDARDFLAGKPDQWGMHVNKSYLVKSGSLYPTSELQPEDPGWSAPTGSDARFQEGFQGTWNPISGLSNIATTLVANQSTTLDTTTGHCADGTNSCVSHKNQPVNFSKVGSEPAGTRDLWAVTDNPDAAAFNFPTAQLVNSAGNPEGPTPAAMQAALGAMRTNPDKITQYVDHSHEAADGYPLTVVDYAMVPTCGLSKSKAAGVRSFLQHVAGSQATGVAPGTLTPGLVPLDGQQLGALKTAEHAVSGQACTRPPPDRTIGGRHGEHTGAKGAGHGSGGANGEGSSNGSGSGNGSGGGSGGGTHGTTGKTHPTTGSSTSGRAVNAADAGYKPGGQSGSLTMALPIMLLAGAGLLAGGPLTWWLGATPSGRSVLRRLRVRR